MRSKFSHKKLIVFDLDGTLTETKSNLTPDVNRVLVELLKKKRVAIIGGGMYEQFRRQFVSRFACPPSLLPRLFLFPTTATSFYRYRHGWKKVYRKELSRAERAQIKQAFKDVLREIHYVPPKKVYGKVIEDRGTQVTFSALGQDIVAVLGARGVALKKKWKKEKTFLKMKIARMMQKRLPRLGVGAAGFTSVDVTRRGIDKAYGIRQMEKVLSIPIKDMVFIGDALYVGGNDYAVKRTGVDWIAVAGPADAKKVIRGILGDSG